MIQADQPQVEKQRTLLIDLVLIDYWYILTLPYFVWSGLDGIQIKICSWTLQLT